MPDTLGETLLKARLERGETLEQVSHTLHIRPRYLEALECGNYDILPSDVQGKGFLRLYAGHLGLPVQPLLDSWSSRAGTPAPAPAPVQPVVVPLPPRLDEAAAGEGASEDESGEILFEENELNPEDLVAIDSSPVELPPQPPAKAADLLLRIGQQLKKQRQGLNLSLGDVERHTHVRQRYLAALEEGQIENLPSPVQGRGMLSNYAGFLEMDVDALLLQFAEALQSRRVETIAPTLNKKHTGVVRHPKKAPSWRRLITLDLMIGSAIILILVGFAVWAASQVTALQRQKVEPTAPSIAEVLLQTGSPVPLPSASPTIAPNLGTRLPNEGGIVLPAVSATPGATITLPAGSSGPLQVQVVARMQTYLRVSVDGKVTFDGRAIPGNAYSYGGSKRIEMLIGNAAALQVFFNQDDLGSLGFVGQVLSLIFTKDGVVTPTPLYPPTATRTLAPTSTLRPSPTLPTPTITPFIP